MENCKLKGSSKELQEVSILSLLNDPYLLSKVSSEITEGFFDNKDYKLVYKSLKYYYEKYLKVPNVKELLIVIEDLHNEYYGNLSSIKETASKLYESEVPDKDFSYEKVTEFIRRHRIELALGRTIDSVQNGNVNLDSVAADLKNSMTFSLTRSQLYKLSDVDKIGEIKTEALGSSENPVVIKFCIDAVNWCMQYGALIPGTLNMIVAPPGRGKTTLAINQGISAANQGFNSLHVFMGDMKRFDGLLRYTSCYTGVKTSMLVEMTVDQLQGYIRKHNMSGTLGHTFVLSYAAGEVSPNQLVEEIISLQRDNKIHFHQIIVDYDENFAPDEESMYENGGSVYNRMALFATLNKSVMFILCQPKPSFWNQEIIPLEASAESSKKQKIIDLMLTLGSPSKDSSIGTLNIAKNRRGKDGRYIRVRKDGSNARITPITEEEYQFEKQNERLLNKDLDKENS